MNGGIKCEVNWEFFDECWEIIKRESKIDNPSVSWKWINVLCLKDILEIFEG